MDATNGAITQPTPGLTLKAVYVLTDPAMPGLVKTGYTSNEDAKKRDRLASLDRSSVPVQN